MKYGKAQFYADENIEETLVDYMRQKGYRVTTAREAGFAGRDDEFHLQEARRRKAFLFTKNSDFLNHCRFPFHDLTDTAVVILRTEDKPGGELNLGYMMLSLFDEIAASGRSNLAGMKIELKGPMLTFHARIDGQVKQDTVDMREQQRDRALFED